MSSIIGTSQRRWPGIKPIGFCALGVGPSVVDLPLLWCWHVAFKKRRHLVFWPLWFWSVRFTDIPSTSN
jgi:hypothetical protein